MASVIELANLSATAYDSTVVSYKNWRRISVFGVPSGKAFYSEFYTCRATKECVMSIRGTDFDSRDWSDFESDFQLAKGRTPSQLNHAKLAYQRFKAIARSLYHYNYNMYFTGHSLGGGLASLLSATMAGMPTVTFNAPGMQRSYIGGHLLSIVGRYNLRYVDTSQMLHFRATGDPISVATGKHMGEVVDIYVDNWGDGKILGSSRHLAQHSITNMVKSLETRSWYHKDLNFKCRRN